MRHARSPSSRIRRPPPPRPSVNSHIAVDCGSRLDEVRNQHDPTGSRLARPGPGTDSTSSTRSTSVPLGTSAAITGFLSAFRRLMRGGFTYPLDGGPVRVPGGEYFVLRRQSAGERRFAPRLVCPHRGHAWPGHATASDLSLTANTRQRLTVRRAHAYVSAVRQAAVVATGPNTLPAPTPMHAAPTPPR